MHAQEAAQEADGSPTTIGRHPLSIFFAAIGGYLRDRGHELGQGCAALGNLVNELRCHICNML